MKAAEFYTKVVELMERITVALETPEGQPVPGVVAAASTSGETKEAPAETGKAPAETGKEPEAPKGPSFEDASLALREHAQEHGIESATALAISFGADAKETKVSQVPEENWADFIKTAKAGKFTPPQEKEAESKGLFG